MHSTSDQNYHFNSYKLKANCTKAKFSFQHPGQRTVWRNWFFVVYLACLFISFTNCFMSEFGFLDFLVFWHFSCCFSVVKCATKYKTRSFQRALQTLNIFNKQSRVSHTIVNHVPTVTDSKCFLPIPIWCYDIGRERERERNKQVSRSSCASRHSLLGAIFVQACKTFIQHLPTLTAPNKPTTPIHLHPPPPSLPVPVLSFPPLPPSFPLSGAHRWLKKYSELLWVFQEDMWVDFQHSSRRKKVFDYFEKKKAFLGAIYLNLRPYLLKKGKILFSLAFSDLMLMCWLHLTKFDCK